MSNHVLKLIIFISNSLFGGLELWCLKSLSTIFHLCRGGQLHWWRKLEYPEKTNNLSQITDKIYHIMLYGIHLSNSRIRTHNYHMIMAMKAPLYLLYM